MNRIPVAIALLETVVLIGLVKGFSWTIAEAVIVIASVGLFFPLIVAGTVLLLISSADRREFWRIVFTAMGKNWRDILTSMMPRK